MLVMQLPVPGPRPLAMVDSVSGHVWLGEWALAVSLSMLAKRCQNAQWSTSWSPPMKRFLAENLALLPVYDLVIFVKKASLLLKGPRLDLLRSLLPSND